MAELPPGSVHLRCALTCGTHSEFRTRLDSSEQRRKYPVEVGMVYRGSGVRGFGRPAAVVWSKARKSLWRTFGPRRPGEHGSGYCGPPPEWKSHGLTRW